MSKLSMLPYEDSLAVKLTEMTAIGVTCIVHGSTGKTQLLRTLYPDIHIYDSREITEIRSLGGMYIVRNGEIEYVQGVLIEAMQIGKRVCIRKIDLNRPLLQYLMPVINDGALVGNDGVRVTAHKDFRLYFTAAEPFSLRKVVFVGPVRFSFDAVLNSFGALRASIASVYSFIEEQQSQICAKDQDRGALCDGVCCRAEFNCSCDAYLCSGHFRQLIQLANFVQALKQDGDLQTTTANRRVLYQGVINIMLRHESRQLAAFLHVSPEPLVLPNINLAKTVAVEETLRALLANISRRQPTLLVGDTGAGKTALVQYLSDNSEFFFKRQVNLKIVNLSADFDAGALVGGYQSVNFDYHLRRLYTRACMPMRLDVGRKILFENLISRLSNISNISVSGSVSRTEASILLEEAKFYLRILQKRLAFEYIDGLLIDAMRNGTWLLLDEVNLASSDTLALLEAIASKREITSFLPCVPSVEVHSDFMLFACMNPAGDIGKKVFNSSAFNTLTFSDFSSSLACVRAVAHAILQHRTSHTDAICSYYCELRRAVAERRFTNILEPLITGRSFSRMLRLTLRLLAQKRTGSSQVAEISSIYDACKLLFFTQLNINSRAAAIALFKTHFPGFTPVQQTGENEQASWGKGFVLTPKVQMYLFDVELAVAACHPVLLQGDTCTGKTSLIFALAKKHGRRVIRINNHAHTDSADYIGSYSSQGDAIVFKEGPLVQAVRQGSWVILDELNLAPSDVLEVLNRLLDDNRELYIPETDTTVKPHPNFMIFATQNLHYSGRHVLAKSFRNRFVEIFFHEKDSTELKLILEKKFLLPDGFITRIVDVYTTLKTARTQNQLITLRDLFKWARRSLTSYYEVYATGLDIICPRQRCEADKNAVQDVFVEVFRSRMDFEHIDFQQVYIEEASNTLSLLNAPAVSNTATLSSSRALCNVPIERIISFTSGFILTRSYLMLINHIYAAWAAKEPVLLIGDTGIGKTRICEIVAALFGLNLQSINMHSGTECADFVGSCTFDRGVIGWRDGVLVTSMCQGEALLIDEINLAPDAVLERMNSVLEDSRAIFIPDTNCEITAHENFRLIATMNPSGDFGKRELSPALRSRFTEIYFDLDTDEHLAVFDGLSKRKIFIDFDFYRERFIHLCMHNQPMRDVGEAALFSIRRIELAITHIANLQQAFVDPSQMYEMSGVCFSSVIEHKREFIWDDVCDLLGYAKMTDRTRSSFDNTGDSVKRVCLGNQIGSEPYYLNIKESPLYSFSSPTSQLNLCRLLRGLTLGRALLLYGEPGVGKTSLISAVAKCCDTPLLRINLSEQTEMSDLVGSFLPLGSSITFIESELVQFVRNGGWIILDEINLCTQSVIEGLNSLLDHRQQITVNGYAVYAHKSLRIFGTMNPADAHNGRKQLPRSFVDRFIGVPLSPYQPNDVIAILSQSYGNDFVYDPSLSLRGNIKSNELILCDIKVPCVDIQPSIKANGVDSPVQFHKEKCLISYNFGANFTIGQSIMPYSAAPDSYVIVHSQIAQLKLLLNALDRRLPVILTGLSGRHTMVHFAAALRGCGVTEFSCHRDTDTADILGQYVKAEEGDTIFQWRDSEFVSALRRPGILLISSPEMVEKCIFDRLSSLFETERTLNIFEKGVDMGVEVDGSCRFVLCCDEPALLSPAILDRCVLITLAEQYDYIDIFKIYASAALGSSLRMSIFSDNFGNFRSLSSSLGQVDPSNLYVDLRRFAVLGIIPAMLNRILPVTNALLESRISNMFSVELKPEVPYDRVLLQRYRHSSACSVAIDDSFYTGKYFDFVQAADSLSRNNSDIAFIKTLEYSWNFTQAEPYCPSTGCFAVPATMWELKTEFIRRVPLRTLAQYPALAYYADMLGNISSYNTATAIKDLWIPDCDPLLTVRCELENERNSRENELMLTIAQLCRNIYKYGCIVESETKAAVERYYATDGAADAILNALFAIYDSISAEYTNILIDIDKRLGRDYQRFKSVCATITFCAYRQDCELRRFLNEFSDIFDCMLPFIFANRHGCVVCLHAESVLSSIDMAALLIHKGFYSNWPEYEYARYVYASHFQPSDCKSVLVILEAFIASSPVKSQLQFKKLPGSDSIEDTIAVCKANIKIREIFDDNIINQCLTLLFPRKTIASALETRKNLVHLGHDIFAYITGLSNSSSILSMNILSTVENLIENLQNTAREVSLDAVSESLLQYCSNLYKHTSILIIDKNYRYFLYLSFALIGPALLEEFFIGCCVYEHVDRMFFAEKFLSLNHSSLLYNTILQYRAFEIEALAAKKYTECRSKLFKSPALYESSLRTYVDRFLLIPTTTVLSINFAAPRCKGSHSSTGPVGLLAQCGLSEEMDSSIQCRCAQWSSLASKHQKSKVSLFYSERMRTGALTKERVIAAYYNRAPKEPFSYDEVCLAKVFVTVIKNINEGHYTSEDEILMLALLSDALMYVYASFLYFIYKFSDMAPVDIEEGVSFKAGEGVDKTEDNVKEEDICDDYDNNKAGDVDSEGVEMDNEGSLHSVSNEAEGDDAVDPDSNSGSKEQNDNEENCADSESRIIDDGVAEEESHNSLEDIQADADLEESSNTIEESSQSQSSSVSDECDVDTDGSESSNSTAGDGSKEDCSSDSDALAQYACKAEEANAQQTCSVADSYDRRIEGGSIQETQALKAGDGQEVVEGEGTEGFGAAASAELRLTDLPKDCTKLVDLLRVIIANNRATKYTGDYKTGKKLNMRRIIPYIASDFRKDRIWMRKRRNEKMDYTIRIFIDNSRSMHGQSIVELLGGIYSTLRTAFAQLGIPVQLFKFGASVLPCSIEDLNFTDTVTDISWIDDYSDGINIILTDGIFQNISGYRDNFLVLMLDSGNIRKMSKVAVIDNKVFVGKYLDDFTLKYCIISNLVDLEKVFVNALGDMLVNLF